MARGAQGQLAHDFQMQRLNTSDYRGYGWPRPTEDEDDGYPL